MKINVKLLVLVLCLFVTRTAPLFAQQLDSAQAQRFNPHAPWIRWWWNGDKVDTLELKRELRLLHDAGIGGVEINPIEFPSKRCDSQGIPALTWLSDEWLDALAATLREAHRLDMGCDLLVGSGWPFGMETIPMDERAQVMLTYTIEIDWSDSSATKPFVITKKQLFDAVDPKVTVPNPDRQFELVDLFIVPDTVSSIHERHNINIPEGDTIKIYSIASTDNSHTPYNKKYMLYALVRCASFASVINGAPGASGSILDHMNRDAVRHFLYNMSHLLEKRIGLMKNWLRAYFVDSMELEGANWTSDFAEEFHRRRGYDLMPWLPFTMFKVGRLGDVVSYEYGARQSPEFKKKVQQVRHDFELTKAELLHERFTQTFLSWCHEQGVKARAQAYGRGFFPLESSLGYDIPEGESWTTNYLRHRIGEEMPDSDYRRGRAYTMINKYVSSAAHQSRCRTVSAEEMTNTYRMFETTLELLKLGSDMSAISGTTHSVWHGFNYSPPQAGFPGWVQYGSYYNEKNTWWPYFHLLNEYRTRVSAILQHVNMQTDIAILLPTDDLWAEYGVQTEPFPNYPKGSHYEVSQLLWEAVHKNGGNCDFVTPRQLDSAITQNGRIVIGKKDYSVMLVVTSDTNPTLPAHSLGNSELLILPIPNLTDRNYLDWYASLQKHFSLPHAVSIAQPNRFLLQNHYKNDRGDDIYLFANAHLHEHIGSDIIFSEEIYNGRTAWIYDAGTGRREILELDGGAAWLSLSPAESLFIIFEKNDEATVAAAPRWQPSHYEGQRHFVPPMQWHLSLHHAIENWTRDTIMRQLCDLRETQFKDFSGTVTYTAHLHLDKQVVDVGQREVYAPESINFVNLGKVYDICELTVNGVNCGTKWYGERTYDISGLLHPGNNTIEVKVTTTLNNYVHTLTDDPPPGLETTVIRHFVHKRNVPTTPAGLVGTEGHISFF